MEVALSLTSLALAAVACFAAWKAGQINGDAQLFRVLDHLAEQEALHRAEREGLMHRISSPQQAAIDYGMMAAPPPQGKRPLADGEKRALRDLVGELEDLGATVPDSLRSLVG
jgi:hypothetical protein